MKIPNKLGIPTYAGDGAQRTGQTSTDELPGTSGDHRELKDPHWPTPRLLTSRAEKFRVDPIESGSVRALRTKGAVNYRG